MRWKKSMFAVFAMLFVLIAVNPVSGQNRGWQGTSGSPERFLLEVQKGNIPGHSLIHKFGHGTVGTSMVPITASLVYQMPTTAIALEVVSSDADDTSAGAGARTVFIEGLALDGSVVTQTVALNGLTAVSIPTPLWRLYRWYVMTSGVYGTATTGSHQGTLTIRVASAGATWSTIPFAVYPHGQSQIGWYTVPSGYRAYIFTQIVKVDSTKSVDVAFLQRRNADTVSAPFSAFRLVEEFTGVAGAGSGISPDSPIGEFPAFTDIGWLGKVASSTADISVDFEILLIKDGY
jgi:hypothetical protein